MSPQVSLPNALTNGTPQDGEQVRANDDAIVASVNALDNTNIASGAAIDCTKNGALIAVYNDSATTGFVATGAADVTAPTTGANGIACRPYDYTIVALANTDTQIIGISGGTLWAYLVDDTANFN